MYDFFSLHVHYCDNFIHLKGKGLRLYFPNQHSLCFYEYLFTSNLYANDKLDEVQISVANFPPYINEVEQTGVIVNLVKNAFLEKGIKTNISFSTWSEVETAVDGKNHLSFMWSKTAKRKRKWSYSEPVYTNRQVLVSNKSKHGHGATDIDEDTKDMYE